MASKILNQFDNFKDYCAEEVGLIQQKIEHNDKDIFEGIVVSV